MTINCIQIELIPVKHIAIIFFIEMLKKIKKLDFHRQM